MIDFEAEFGDELEAIPAEHVDRSRFVPGVGSIDADVVLVGEAPGATEVEQGTPFVGPAGGQLDRTLQALGIDRDDLYITNLVKVRPPDNRTPYKTEIAAWRPLLDAELERVDPTVIVPLGTTATQALLGTDEGVSTVHGQQFDRDGRLVIPVYHPAAVLYDRDKLAPFQADLRAALEAVA